MTLTLIFDPTKLRVRSVQEGSFMRAGGVPVVFTQQVSGNRVDITLSRSADATGASGTGLLAAMLFDAIAPGPRDADAQRHGHRAGRHGDGPAVQAGHDYGAVSRDRGLRIADWRIRRGATRSSSCSSSSTIILILASAIMPLAKVTAQRTREAELRRALREMRTAIDKYKDAADLGQIGSLDIKVGSENYPPDLQTLVDGVTAANDATGRKLKFLRHIPVDPMTHSTEWGMRSYQDKPDSTRWGGQNVFDVYTTFDGKALDGTKYKDW